MIFLVYAVIALLCAFAIPWLTLDIINQKGASGFGARFDFYSSIFILVMLFILVFICLGAMAWEVLTTLEPLL